MFSTSRAYLDFWTHTLAQFSDKSLSCEDMSQKREKKKWKQKKRAEQNKEVITDLQQRREQIAEDEKNSSAEDEEEKAREARAFAGRTELHLPSRLICSFYAQFQSSLWAGFSREVSSSEDVRY